MSAIEIKETTQWQAWTALVSHLSEIQRVENVASIGTPPERVGGAIVDEFADDLRRLADA